MAPPPPPTEPEPPPPPVAEHSQRGERRASLSALSSSAAYQRLGGGAALASARRERRSSLAVADPGAFQLPPEATRNGGGAPPPIPAWMRDLKRTVQQRRVDGTLTAPGGAGSGRVGSLGGLSRLPGRAAAPSAVDDSSVTESLVGKPEFVRKQRKMNFRKEEAILEACGKLDAEAQRQINRLLHENLATKVRHYNQATSEVRIVRRPPEAYQQGLYRRDGGEDNDSDSEVELEFVRAQQELKDPSKRTLYASSTSLSQQSPPTASRPPLSPASPSASPKASENKKSATAAKPTSYQLTLIMKFREILAGKLDDATRAQVEALLLEALVEEAVLRDEDGAANEAGAAGPAPSVDQDQNPTLHGSPSLPSVAKNLPRRPSALEQRLTSGKQRQPQEANLDDEGSLAGKPEFIKKFRKMNFAKDEHVLEASGCNVFGASDETRPTATTYTPRPSAGRGPQQVDSESMMHASVPSINPISLNNSSKRELMIRNNTHGLSVKVTSLHQSAPALRYDRNQERTTAMNDSSASFSNSLSLSQAFSTDNLFSTSSEKSSTSGRQSEVLEKSDQMKSLEDSIIRPTQGRSPRLNISSFGETSTASAVSSVSASKGTALAVDYSAQLDMSELLFEQDEEGTGPHHNEAAEYIKARTLQAALETGHLNDSEKQKASMQLDMILSSHKEPGSDSANEPEWRRKFRQMKCSKDESIVEASKGSKCRQGDETSRQKEDVAVVSKKESTFDDACLSGSATPSLEMAQKRTSRENCDAPTEMRKNPVEDVGSFNVDHGYAETVSENETVAVKSEVEFMSDPVISELSTNTRPTTERHRDSGASIDNMTERMDMEGVASFGDFDLQPRAALDDDGGSDLLEKSKANQDTIFSHIESPRTTDSTDLFVSNMTSSESISKPEPPGSHLSEVTEKCGTPMTRQQSHRASKVSSCAESASTNRSDKSSRNERQDCRNRSPDKTEKKTQASVPHHRSHGTSDKPRRHSANGSGHHEGKHERRASQSAENQAERRHSRSGYISSQSRRTSHVQSDLQKHKQDSRKSRPSQSRRLSLDERTSGSRSSGDSRSSAVELATKSSSEEAGMEEAAARHLSKLSLIDRRSSQKRLVNSHSKNDGPMREKERSTRNKEDLIRKGRDDRSLKSKESHDTRTSTEKESSCESSEQKKSVDESSSGDIVFSPMATREHVRPIESPPSRRKGRNGGHADIRSPTTEKPSRRSSERGTRDHSEKSVRAHRSSTEESSRLSSGFSDGTRVKRSSLSSKSSKKEAEEVNAATPVLPMDFTEFDEDEEDDLEDHRSRMSSFDDPWADTEMKPSSHAFGEFPFAENFGRKDGIGSGPLTRNVSSGSGNLVAPEKLVGQADTVSSRRAAGFDADFDLSSPGASLGSDRPVPKRGLGRSRSIDMSPVRRDSTEKSRRGRRSEHLVRTVSAFESTADFEFTVTKPPMEESSPSAPSRSPTKTTRSRDKSRKKETMFDTYDWTMP